MTQPRNEWHLDTRRIGRRVLHFDRLDSTNSYAASLASDRNNDGLVIVADGQTAGRGQHGRNWHCPAGDGVLLSALLFPPEHLRRPVVLAAWATVAVCQTIFRATGLEPQIKWPNDVFVEGRKVCGILIEQGTGTITGIGLNVNQSSSIFAAAGLPEAASLASLTGANFDVSELARALIKELDYTYDRLLADAAEEVESEWQSRLNVLGRTVDVQCATVTHRGKLRALSFECLEVAISAAQTVRLNPEKVRHIRAV